MNYVLIFILMFLVSCKQKTKATKSLHSVNNTLIVNNSIDSTLNPLLLQNGKKHMKIRKYKAKQYLRKYRLCNA